jgi:hypothetical protein
MSQLTKACERFANGSFQPLADGYFLFGDVFQCSFPKVRL